MGIGRLMDISVRTMQAYREAMDITSNNISNAGNADYTRQTVVMTTTTGANGLGNGVKVSDVIRVRSDILDQQIRRYQSALSDANRRSETLSQIEAIVGEPSDEGLSTYFSKFFNSWNELSANPTSTQLRSNIVQSASQLSDKLKGTIDGLTDIQYSAQQNAVQNVNDINMYLKSIYELNQQIYDSEARGVKANELKDERDVAIDNLSKLINISVNKNDSGAVMVNVGGIYGADQTGYNTFKLQINNGKMQLVNANNSSQVVIVNGGEFNANADMFSNQIPSYIQKLKDLATNLVSEVNSLHMSGYSLSSSGSKTSIPFFGALDANGNVINAFMDGQLQINEDILNDPGLIAISSQIGMDGNSDFARKISELNSKKIPGLGNQTFNENYSILLGSIGSAKNSADNSVKSNELVVQNLSSQKSSNSGVSLDEEMANILKYQRSFDASAKMIKIADDMLQTLIDMLR